MKKVFIVRRTDKIDYDEFDSVVIIADNEQEVIDIIEGRVRVKEYEGNMYKCDYWDRGSREIEEIDLANCGSMELLASFNAG